MFKYFIAGFLLVSPIPIIAVIIALFLYKYYFTAIAVLFIGHVVVNVKNWFYYWKPENLKNFIESYDKN